MRWRDPRRLIIVAAEDDPDDQLLLVDALEESGLEADLRILDDGEQLLDYLRADGPPEVDLVVLDLKLPRKDGRAALRELKADRRLRAIPVVVLTTSSNPADADGILRDGACAHLVKPPSFASLVAIVRLFPTYAGLH